MKTQEELLKALEHCQFYGKTDRCDQCEYKGLASLYCDALIVDVIHFLKRKSFDMLVKTEMDGYTGVKEKKCPSCGVFIDKTDPRNPWKEVKFCKYCGQAVRWK